MKLAAVVKDKLSSQMNLVLFLVGLLIVGAVAPVFAVSKKGPGGAAPTTTPQVVINLRPGRFPKCVGEPISLVAGPGNPDFEFIVTPPTTPFAITGFVGINATTHTVTGSPNGPPPGACSITVTPTGGAPTTKGFPVVTGDGVRINGKWQPQYQVPKSSSFPAQGFPATTFSTRSLVALPLIGTVPAQLDEVVTGTAAGTGLVGSGSVNPIPVKVNEYITPGDVIMECPEAPNPYASSKIQYRTVGGEGFPGPIVINLVGDLSLPRRDLIAHANLSIPASVPTYQSSLLSGLTNPNNYPWYTATAPKANLRVTAAIFEETLRVTMAGYKTSEVFIVNGQWFGQNQGAIAP